jgi:hypothetical protein
MLNVAKLNRSTILGEGCWDMMMQAALSLPLRRGSARVRRVVNADMCWRGSHIISEPGTDFFPALEGSKNFEAISQLERIENVVEEQRCEHDGGRVRASLWTVCYRILHGTWYSQENIWRAVASFNATTTACVRGSRAGRFARPRRRSSNAFLWPGGIRFRWPCNTTHSGWPMLQNKLGTMRQA